MKKNYSIILKDGIIITKKTLVLNVNKNRKYELSYNGKILASNLLYRELIHYIKIARKVVL